MRSAVLASWERQRSAMLSVLIVLVAAPLGAGHALGRCVRGG
jgi:hypothetical protein